MSELRIDYISTLLAMNSSILITIGGFNQFVLIIDQFVLIGDRYSDLNIGISHEIQ